MTTELVFAEPPATKASGANSDRVWTERLAQLMEHPGEWVDATATWSVTRVTKAGPAYRAAADLGITIEVRNMGGSAKSVPLRCYLRVVA